MVELFVELAGAKKVARQVDLQQTLGPVRTYSAPRPIHGMELHRNIWTYMQFAERKGKQLHCRVRPQHVPSWVMFHPIEEAE
jgi:hypothetical protein